MKFTNHDSVAIHNPSVDQLLNGWLAELPAIFTRTYIAVGGGGEP